MTSAPVTSYSVLFDGSRNMNPDDIGFLALIAEDFHTHGCDFFSQGFWALFWHRFGNWRMSVPRPFRCVLTIIYRIMFKLCECIGGIHLPYPVKVGRRVRLDHYGMVLAPRSIGDDVVIRQNTTMGVVRSTDLANRPTIGSNVELGAGVVILGNVTIHDNACVGANAVVIDDVAAHTVVGGVPARVLKLPCARALGLAKADN